MSKYLGVLFFIVFACLLVYLNLADAANEFQVVDLKGNVQYKLVAEQQWKPLQKNALLTQGHEISTAADAHCFIKIDKSVLEIRPQSKIALASFTPVSFNLQTGKVFALVRDIRKGSRFEIKTPVAIAAARGTGWSQTTNTINVFEDTVGVSSNSGQNRDIPQGSGVLIGDDGSIGDLHTNSDTDNQQWGQFYSSAAGFNSGDSSDNGDDSGWQNNLQGGSGTSDRLDDLKDQNREGGDQERIETERDKKEQKSSSQDVNRNEY